MGKTLSSRPTPVGTTCPHPKHQLMKRAIGFVPGTGMAKSIWQHVCRACGEKVGKPVIL